MARRCQEEAEAEISETLGLPSLREGQSDWKQMLNSLGILHTRGGKVDWPGFEQDYERQKVILPNYPFQGKRYWTEKKQVRSHKSATPHLHPLLGHQLHSPAFQSEKLIFEQELSSRENGPDWLADHIVYGKIVLPATAYLEMILAAGRIALDTDTITIEEFDIQQALILPENGAKTVQTILTSQQEQNMSHHCRIVSLTMAESGERKWTVHAEARVSVAETAVPPAGADDLAEVRERCKEGTDAETFYHIFEHAGITYGNTFKTVRSLHSGEEEALARIVLPDEELSRMDEYHFHPVLLDGCLQVVGEILSAEQHRLSLPVGAEQLSVACRPRQGEIWCHVRMKSDRDRNPLINLTMTDADGMRVASLTNLKVRQASEKALLSQAKTLNWLYELRWEPQQQSRTEAAADAGAENHWLILADDTGIGEQLADRLKAGGESCWLVKENKAGPGEASAPKEDRALTVPNTLSDMELMLTRQKNRTDSRITGVVHLWGLNMAEQDLTTAAMLEGATELGCGSTLHLVQALTRAGYAVPFYLITRGAQSVRRNRVSPEGFSQQPGDEKQTGLSGTHTLAGLAQSPLWGMGRVIALEYPELTLTMIDLDSPEKAEADDDAAHLSAELGTAGKESYVAFRDGQRYVARLLPTSPASLNSSFQTQEKGQDSPGTDTLIRPDRSYIISGAFGGLGLLVADWLVTRGAGQLILVGRSGPDEAARELLNRWREAGADLKVVCADVSAEHDSREILAPVLNDAYPLGGIIHAAGVLDDGLLQQQNWSRFRSVLAPKVQGAWHLHQLSLGHDPDFFVMFSSLNSLLGNEGQANYAAANSFLDALAAYRRNQGLAATAVNWSIWADVGMGTGEKMIAQTSRKGLMAIPPDEGIRMLETVLLADMTQVAVAPVNWSRFRTDLLPAGVQAFLSRTESGQTVPGTLISDRPTQGQLQKQMKALPHNERADFLQHYVRQTVAEVLGDSEQVIDPRQGFFDLGMDSIAAVELRDRMQKDLGCQLPGALTFNYPTTETLLEYLTDHPHLAPLFAAPEITEVAAHHTSESASSESRFSEPIAIIGMGCRFPGADNPREFWELLREGRDAIIEVPSDRWDVEAFYDPDPNVPGKMYTRHGGFLAGATHFSAEFFGLSPREAIRMDPQQRLLLEVTWEALENAGLRPSQLMGSGTGVFVGIMNNNYIEQQLKSNPVQIADDPYFSMGSSSSAASGRLSYFLGLQGPNIALDTACSSSLVTLHLARQSLQREECELAIAGGVNMIAVPETLINACKMGMLAKDGRCKTFDEKADGYVAGEGCGMLVLKRLKDARRDNDTVLAVVRGTSVNEDGRSSSLTAPNGLAQQEVIRRALAEADVRPHQISYIEAHGTGTAMGDVVEVEAARSVLEKERTVPFHIGSAKTNIGHLVASAGAAGVMKIVLALQHKTIPPHLNLDVPNPRINWNDELMRVPAEATPWHPLEGRRLAGISSFGWSGTNAHAIIEHAEPPESYKSAQNWHILPLSAKTGTALDKAGARLSDHLKHHSREELADVAHTLQTGRDAFSERRVVLCQTRSQAIEALENPGSERVLSGTQAARQRPVTFMFPGTGDQYPGMGRQLYEQEPVFRESIDACCEILQPLTGSDLRDVLYPDEELTPDPESRPGLDFARMLGRDDRTTPQQLDRTVFAHPVLFMTEFALAKLWMHRGIRPRNMIGYSLGEFVAACLAGVFSLEDGLKLVAGRARLIDDLPAGAMLAVGAGEEDVRPYLDDGVSVSGINGPMMCVVAGGEDDIARMRGKLEDQGLACRPLKTTHAFHSEKMAPVRPELEKLLASVRLGPPRIPYISNVTGDWITDGQATDPGYWLTHMLNPVHFAKGIETVWQDPDAILLEVGVGQTLGSLFMQHPLGHEINNPLVLSSLPVSYDQQDDTALMLRSLGQLWLTGTEPDWDRLYPDETRRKVSLPTYPFEHTDYWQTGRNRPDAPASGQSPEIAVRENMDDWFYIPVWRQDPLPPLSPPSVMEWLIFADGQGLGTEIAGQLQAAGQKTTLVMPGEDFKRVRDGVYTVSTQTGKDYAALITHLYKTNQPPERILHLWSVASAGSDTASEPENTLETQAEGFYSLLWLAQALGEQTDLKKTHIWVVSDNMRNVLGSEPIRPAAATVLGPCKVIPFEYPRLSCTSADVSLDADSLPVAARHLGAELLADIRPETVAFRGSLRWSHRFGPFPLRQAGNAGNGQPGLRRHGVYLITGGFGGLGYAVAESLAGLQAGLVLIGRTELPERQDWESVLRDDTVSEAVRDRIGKILALEKCGADVLALSADVADLSQMQAVVGQAREQFGQIHGVFHIAGVPGAGLIQLKTPEAVERVFAPKVRGTLVLDSLFGDANLDFMILYSSVTAITGGLGEVDYCAANAFLDAYSHHNRVRGRFPTFAINWGAWKWDAWQSDLLTVLPEVYQSIKTMREEHGLTFGQGNEALSRILGSGLPQVAVSPQELTDLTAWWERLKITDFADTVRETGTDHEKYPRPRLRTPYVPPGTDAEQAIARLWAEALSLEKVGIHDRFFELGGNSLVGIRIVGQMKKMFDRNLSAAILYESPTVSALGKLLTPETEVETDERTVNPHLERGRKRRKLQAGRRKSGKGKVGTE